MITNKKYILFDLDGTLTDPKLGICTCVQYALKEFDIEEPDLDKLEPFIGPPLKDSFMKYYNLTEEQAERAIEKYRERFSVTGKFENKVYEGIPELLKDLKDYGYQLAVASSKPECFVKDILVHFNIARFFDVVVGSELDGSRVDKAEVIHETLNRLFHYRAFQKDQIVMIGDRKFDVEGAKDIGVTSVAVAYGYGSHKELRAAKPDHLAETVEELRALLMDETLLPERREAARQKALEKIKQGQQEAQKKPQENRTTFQCIWKMLFPFLLFYVTLEFLRQAVGMLLLFLSEKNEALYQFMLVAEDTTEETWAISGNGTAVIQILSFLGVFVVLYTIGSGKKYLAKAREAAKTKVFKPAEWAAWLGLAVISAVGLNMFFVAIGWISINPAYLEAAKSMYAVSIPLGIVLYGVISPLVEEVLFRGMIYAEAKSFMKPFAAVLASSALFGLYHGNTVQLFYSFLLGMILVQAYRYSGRILVPIVLHGVVNTLVFLATNFTLFKQNTVQLVLGAILSVAGVIMFFLFKKHYDKTVLN